MLTPWWLNQPLWKICSSKWVHPPQFPRWTWKNVWNISPSFSCWMIGNSHLSLNKKNLRAPKYLKQNHPPLEPQNPWKNEGFKPPNIWVITVITPKKWRFLGFFMAVGDCFPKDFCFESAASRVRLSHPAPKGYCYCAVKALCPAALGWDFQPTLRGRAKGLGPYPALLGCPGMEVRINF